MVNKYDRIDEGTLNPIVEEHAPKRRANSIDSEPSDPDEDEYTLLPQWKTVFSLLVLFLTTAVALSQPLEATEARAACVIVATALLWITEALPLMISALVPAIMFPLVGIMDTKVVCSKYFNYISMLMMGTFLVAESVEACGLHRRIALKILSLLGRGEALLMLGSSLCTWILSMFMSNTATTAMMLPIVGSIVQSLREINRAMGDNILTVKFDNDDENLTQRQDSARVDIVKADGKRFDSKEFKWFCKGLFLCVPYGASIGGIATLTGTPPNLVLKSTFETEFPGQKAINYQTWFKVCFPLSLILVICGWTVLCQIYARNSYWNLVTLRFLWNKTARSTSKEHLKWKQVNKIIRKEYSKLGGFRFPEIVLLVMVGALVVLWLFRELQGVGWAEKHAETIGDYNDEGKLKIYLKDAWVVLILSLFLFIIPAENPFRGRLTYRPQEGGKFKRLNRLLDLNTVLKRTPWDVLFILGGGYAIAAGCKDSGLSGLIGEGFSFLKEMHHVVIALVVSCLVAVLTEFASNTASTQLLLPVLVSLSQAIKVHPLYLMMTGTLSASLAFCLPSATGPNAIVFAYPEIKVIDMIRTGLVMNVVSVLVTVGATSTWIYTGLNLSEYPCWAYPVPNCTITGN